jgi:alanine-glyoxylate transaminase / serine-glyoxylate transaminase / serine-pyruvate transaminase
VNKPLLMIPGPVEVDANVLEALGRPPLGHTSPKFIEIFGACLDSLRTVFAAPDGLPVVVAGSGTLAMEMAVANVVERGNRAVVVETGTFSQRMADILKRSGAEIEVVSAEVGQVPEPEQVEAALKKGAKVLTVTHVDTSTGVLAPVQKYAQLARRYGALVIVDGVCAVAGQEFRQTDWEVDICLTASQKALACPPGLALVMARPRALEAFRARTTPVSSYYADWTLWLPVVQAYLDRKPAYFATPPVNLVAALGESVRQITAEGMDARWRRHQRLSEAFKAGIAALGLKQIPAEKENQAATLTTIYFPDGVDASLVKRISELGVEVAGGLYPTIKTRYFRVGHMGSDGMGEILQTLSAIEKALNTATGVGVAAANRAWLR